jgi:hypothetical protein
MMCLKRRLTTQRSNIIRSLPVFPKNEPERLDGLQLSNEPALRRPFLNRSPL